MKTNMMMKVLFLGVFITSSILSYSQSYQDSLKKDDDDIISSIAPYPADVRDAILDVSQYAQKLVKIERIQSRTSQSFQDLVSSYSREDQAKFYELSRYPDLIHQLASGPPQTLEQVKPTLANYPKEVNDAVAFLFPIHMAELTSMDKTYQSSQDALQQIIADVPNDAQADFKKVLSMPDVMSLLTDRIDLVVSLGETYKQDPQGVKSKLDELSNKINDQNQKDLDDYKKQVANDPQMQDEMKQSAQEFADNYSNGQTDQNESPSDAALDQSQQQSNYQQQPATVVNNYYSTNYSANPYPYWFGYPYWYTTPMWYPRPLYYYTGFYIGAGGSVVVMGLPSIRYSRWFFNYGYARYPHFYNYCNHYYTAHQTFVSRNVYRGFNTHVNNHFANLRRNDATRNNMNREQRGNSNRNVTQQRAANNLQRENTVNNAHRENAMNNMNRSENRQAPAANNRMNNDNFRNSIKQPSNPNNQSFNTFHATQFHQQSWGNVGGGARSSGGGFSGGGVRSGGGSFNGGGVRSGGGGGFHGGGGRR